MAGPDRGSTSPRTARPADNPRMRRRSGRNERRRREIIWSAVASGARHRFGWGRSTAHESAVAAALCRRTPNRLTTSARFRFMGGCQFRLELLTGHEPRSGACPSRAQQRPLPGDGWKVPIVPPWRALLRPGTGALRGRARRSTTPVIRGSWAGGFSPPARVPKQVEIVGGLTLESRHAGPIISGR